MVFNATFHAVMNQRTIEDIVLKMEVLQKLPQDQIISLFLEMCDIGINLYIKSEQEKYPQKKSTDIMREYFMKQGKTRGQKNSI